MKASGDASALERLVTAELLAGGHKTGHFLLGQVDFSAAERREAEVGDLVLGGWLGGSHFDYGSIWMD